jgi:hypothetical protein
MFPSPQRPARHPSFPSDLLSGWLSRWSDSPAGPVPLVRLSGWVSRWSGWSDGVLAPNVPPRAAAIAFGREVADATGP